MRQCLTNAKAFVIPEEKQFVFDDGASQRKAELVLLIGLLAEEVKGIDGVEFVVAQKLPEIAVELVAARLDDGVHDRAVAAAEFRAVGIGFDLELGDGIHCGLHHVSRAVEHVAKIRVVIDAVEQKVILQRASAVRTEPVRSFDARTRLGGGDARAQ